MIRLALGLAGHNRKGEKVEKAEPSYSPSQVKRAAMAALLVAAKTDDVDDALAAFDLLMDCEE